MTNWILFVGASLLASVLWGRSKPAFLWVIATLLIMVAAQSFAETSIGSFTARTVIGVPLGFFGSPSAWATVLLLFALAYAIFDVVVDKKLDKGGAMALFVIPLLALLAGGGSLVSGIGSIYNAVQDGAASVINSI